MDLLSQDLITIIVPIYNVERYLKQCILSIQLQTYRNLEIILVDDGSKDASGNICDEFAGNDMRIRAIHQKNTGLSAARNIGIDVAQGKYIMFIDSDDYIAPDCIEKLYNALIETDGQMSVCDYAKVDENVEFVHLNYSANKEVKTIVLSNIEAIRNVYGQKMHGVDFISCAKLYNLDLFKTNNIRFPVGKIHEDAFTTYKLLYETKSIAYIDIPMYFYRTREGSITTGTFSMKKLDKLEATRQECDFFRRIGNNELLKLAFYDHLHENRIIMKSMADSSSDEIRSNMKLVGKKLDEDISLYCKYIAIPLKKRLYYKLLSKFPRSFIIKL